MFTSDTEKKRIRSFRSALSWLFVTLFVALFGAVYEAFSHGVYSYYMLYAFAFPLVLGVLPALLLGLRRKSLPRPIQSIGNAAIATLTVGSLVSGALEIYGTTNPLTAVYWLLGGALLLTALFTALITFILRRRAQA